jgi:hypothetical protein
VPKVGGRNQKKTISAMPKTPSTKLRNSKCGQSNFFAFNLLLLAAKIGDQEQNVCFEPCLDLHAQSWNNFLCVQPLTFNVENRRPRAEKFDFNHA